jgi:Flp pilus assembly pilin Flp
MPNRFNITSRVRSAMAGACGQTMTEYALIMAAIAIVAIVAYTTLGTTKTDLVNKVIACL